MYENSSLDHARERAFEKAAQAFVHNYFNEAQYNKALDELMQLETLEELNNYIQTLPSVSLGLEASKSLSSGYSLGDLQNEVQVLKSEGSVIRKEGFWLKSSKLLVKGSASVLRLNLKELSQFRDTSIHIHFELTGSLVRIDLPRGCEVEDNLNRQASVSRIRTRGPNPRALKVILEGDLNGCVLRIRTRRFW